MSDSEDEEVSNDETLPAGVEREAVLAELVRLQNSPRPEVLDNDEGEVSEGEIGDNDDRVAEVEAESDSSHEENSEEEGSPVLRVASPDLQNESSDSSRNNSPQPSTSGAARPVMTASTSTGYSNYSILDSSDDEDPDLRSPPRKNLKLGIVGPIIIV